MRNVLAVAIVLVVAGQSQAQSPSGDLALLIPGLFGPDGLIVDSAQVLPDGSTHSAHFNSAFQTEFGQFNVALGSQLGSVPLPSPASGYTYEFDSSLGVFKRSTQSFGPLMSERAETVGRGKFTIGFAYQDFRFDSIEGMDMDAIPAVFSHDDAELGGGRSDLVTTVNSIHTEVHRYVSFLTYGLADRVDVALAVPMVTTRMRVASRATVRRVGTVDPEIHYFEDPNGEAGSEHVYASSGSATGLGDLILRVKTVAPRIGSTSLALVLETRLPTGDEANLLGSGAWGATAALVSSWTLGRASPHLDVAYRWNGSSVLAGDVAEGTKEDLPDQVSYAFGFDVGINPTVTLAIDLLGQRFSSSPRLVARELQARDGQTFDNIAFEDGSFFMHDLAVGGKINMGGQVLLDAGLIIKLDDPGLRDKVTPLVGVEYSF